MATSAGLATSGLHSKSFFSANGDCDIRRVQHILEPLFLTSPQRQGIQVRSPPSCSYANPSLDSSTNPLLRNTTNPKRTQRIAAAATGALKKEKGGNFLSLDMNSDRPLTEEEKQQQRRKEVSKKIQELGRKGQASAAVQEMVAMMEEGIMPDRVAATALVQACIQAGDTKRAESIFDRFFGKDGALIADTVAFGTLLRTYAANKPPRWPKIMALVASMETEYNTKPTAGVYNILLGVCAVTNDTERAIDLMQKMEAEDIGPDMLTYEAIRRRRVLRNQYRTVFARFLNDEEDL